MTAIRASRWSIPPLPASTTFETQPTRHNKWVDDVQAELLRFTTKLACADVAPDALTILWRQAASVIQDALVDGFSGVKKCTDAGRALMTLDVKTLRTEFTKLAPPSASVEWRYVDTYIDAFYVPESEARRWMAVHPEFSKAHKTALAHQVSAARRMERQTPRRSPHRHR